MIREEQQKAFEELKRIFSSEPTLMLPDPYKAFFLETDTSLVATGAVLYQINQEGEYQPCSFISQSLDATQQKYDIYDRELLAIYRALTMWRQYLLHSNFPITIWTDHENLTRFREVKKLSPRQV